jgi:hypothetical protein
MSKPEKVEKPEQNNEPEEWTPDKPIPDEDGETEAQRRHMLQRRLNYLNEQAEAKSKSKGKGKDGKEKESKPWLVG